MRLSFLCIMLSLLFGPLAGQVDTVWTNVPGGEYEVAVGAALCWRVDSLKDSLFVSLYQPIDSIKVVQFSQEDLVSGWNVHSNDIIWPQQYSDIVVPASDQPVMLCLREVEAGYKQDSIKMKVVSFNSRAEQLLYRSKALAEKSEEYLGQRIFLGGLFTFIVLGVFIPWLIWRDALISQYLLYALAVFIFYFIRKLTVFEGDLPIPRSGLKYAFQAIWNPVIVYTYIRFIEVFLNPVEGQLSKFVKIIKGYAVVGLAITILLLVVADEVAANRFIVYFRYGVLLLSIPVIFRLLFSKGSLYRIVIAGIIALVLGLGLLQLNDVLKVKYDVDIEPGYISFIQYGVIVELFIYWFGMLYRQGQVNKRATVAVSKIAQMELVEEQLRNRIAENEEEFLTVGSRQKKYRWARTQVQCFVADREVCRVLLADGSERTVLLRLKEIEAQLPASFIRVHRSYLVRLAAISVFDRGKAPCLRLAGVTRRIPVGKEGARLLNDRLEDDFGQR